MDGGVRGPRYAPTLEHIKPIQRRRPRSPAALHCAIVLRTQPTATTSALHGEGRAPLVLMSIAATGVVAERLQSFRPHAIATVWNLHARGRSLVDCGRSEGMVPVFDAWFRFRRPAVRCRGLRRSDADVFRWETRATVRSQRRCCRTTHRAHAIASSGGPRPAHEPHWQQIRRRRVRTASSRKRFNSSTPVDVDRTLKTDFYYGGCWPPILLRRVRRRRTRSASGHAAASCRMQDRAPAALLRNSCTGPSASSSA